MFIKRVFVPVFVALLVVTSLSARVRLKHTTVESMNYEELQIYSLACIEKGDKGGAINGFEHMISRYSEKSDLQKFQMMLANLYFSKKEYGAADKHYERLMNVNPSKAEYAAYKSILCKFKQMLPKDRDQTPTKKALAWAQGFLKAANYAKSKYRKDVKNIVYSCEKKLIQHEVCVFNFYLKQDKVKSAENRLSLLRKDYLDKHSDLEPQLLFLEGKLAQCRKDKSKFDENKKILLDKFPKSEFTTLANKKSGKREFLFF